MVSLNLQSPRWPLLCFRQYAGLGRAGRRLDVVVFVCAWFCAHGEGQGPRLWRRTGGGPNSADDERGRGGGRAGRAGRSPQRHHRRRAGGAAVGAHQIYGAGDLDHPPAAGPPLRGRQGVPTQQLDRRTNRRRRTRRRECDPNVHFVRNTSLAARFHTFDSRPLGEPEGPCAEHGWAGVPGSCSSTGRRRSICGSGWRARTGSCRCGGCPSTPP